MKIYTIQELREASKKFCFELCPLKEFGECVLNTDTTGTICNLDYFIEKLTSGELRK